MTKAENQHIECAPALVDQHLVDHDLGEQRRDEGEALEEQRSRQRLTQQPAEPHDRWNEPGQIEGTVDANPSLPCRHEDQLAGPARLEGSPLLDGGTIGPWVLHKDAIGRHPRQDNEGSVAQERNRRQDRLVHALGR
jgi:hypothetical protein